MSFLRFFFTFSLVAMMGTALSPQVASSQTVRDGFFIGVGLGAGSFGVEDADEREMGLSGYFKIGGALNDQLLLGAETQGWTKEEDGVTVQQGSLTATAYLYPSPESGFFLKGGLGMANISIDLGAFGSGDETGTALMLGGGFDIGFGGTFGVTPYGSFVYGSFDGGSTTLFQFGVGANWY